MIRHCNLTDNAKEIFDNLWNENKSAVIVLGHHGNWEWAGNTFSILCRQPLYVIYHPLANKHFNKLLCGMRGRFGTRLIAMRDTFHTMKSLANEVNITAFIADQTPPPQQAYWMPFLHQETPVYEGTERIARKLNFPVVYVDIKRTQRGYYTITAEELAAQPALTDIGNITEGHTQRLERDIIAQPETWLWSHRRWKHKRPEDKILHSKKIL